MHCDTSEQGPKSMKRKKSTNKNKNKHPERMKMGIMIKDRKLNVRVKFQTSLNIF
jgi:hypothetical protein